MGCQILCLDKPRHLFISRPSIRKHNSYICPFWICKFLKFIPHSCTCTILGLKCMCHCVYWHIPHDTCIYTHETLCRAQHIIQKKSLHSYCQNMPLHTLVRAELIFYALCHLTSRSIFTDANVFLSPMFSYSEG